MSRKRFHDKLVKEIAKNPEKLEIQGLSEENVIETVFSPHLKKNGCETGDLIIIWKDKNDDILEVLVLELTTAERRSDREEIRKLERSFYHFFVNPDNALNVLSEVSGEKTIREADTVRVRGVAVRYCIYRFPTEDKITKREIGPIHLKR